MNRARHPRLSRASIRKLLVSRPCSPNATFPSRHRLPRPCHRDEKQLCATLLISDDYKLPISQLLSFDIHTKCRGVGVSPTGILKVRLEACSLFIPSTCQLPQHLTPFFSNTSELFQVPYPVSPLFATLTKTAGCIPTLPKSELVPGTAEGRHGVRELAPAVSPWQLAAALFASTRGTRRTLPVPPVPPISENFSARFAAPLLTTHHPLLTPHQSLLTPAEVTL